MAGNLYDNSNIFAKILRGEIPCHRVYEDAAILAFMDAMPQAPGHVLVVPKASYRNLLDADPSVLSQILPVLQRIAKAVQAAFDADGIFVCQLNEPAAGQTVFHLHFHVIPRHDGVSLAPHSGGMEAHDVLAEHAKNIRAQLD